MKVKAIKPCYYYGGREPGEVFDTTGQFGHMLVRMGKAVSAEGNDVQTNSDDKPKRGKYARKDMQAVGDTK